MNDDEFDDLLRDAAATYNLPPAPPRDAIWDAIARGRAIEAPVVSTGRTRHWVSAAAGIAAVLLAGIVIGRASRGPTPAPIVVASVPTPAPRALPAAADTASEAPDASLDTQHATRDAEEQTATRRLSAAQRRLSVAALRAARRDGSSPPVDPSTDATAYRLAVVEHLSRTEVLLTSFRAEAQSGGSAKLDAQFASLSRELLGTTRLLLATRRGEDPAITRLLQDLEFVLMQLSQYANDGRRADLDAINQSLDRRNVIPKLRSNIPAGVSASAGT